MLVEVLLLYNTLILMCFVRRKYVENNPTSQVKRQNNRINTILKSLMRNYFYWFVFMRKDCAVSSRLFVNHYIIHPDLKIKIALLHSAFQVQSYNSVMSGLTNEG